MIDAVVDLLALDRVAFGNVLVHVGLNGSLKARSVLRFTDACGLDGVLINARTVERAVPLAVVLGVVSRMMEDFIEGLLRHEVAVVFAVEGVVQHAGRGDRVAGEHRRPARAADRGLCVAVRHARSLRRQSVNVGRLDHRVAGTTQRVVA